MRRAAGRCAPAGALLLATLLPRIARAAPAAQRAPWVLVDTRALSVSVLSPDDRLIARMRNVAIGSDGAADTHLRGDQTTPRGTYRIAWINHHSRFGLFFGLDYPTPAIAAQAYREGRIDRGSLDAVLAAFRAHRIPPQDTALGGQIGIHGTASGSPPWIQRSVNWTDGCVALTPAQLREFARWARVGTRVVIR